MIKYRYTGETIGIESYEKELNNLAIRLVNGAEYELVTLTTDGEFGYFRDGNNRSKRVPMDVMEQAGRQN